MSDMNNYLNSIEEMSINLSQPSNLSEEIKDIDSSFWESFAQPFMTRENKESQNQVINRIATAIFRLCISGVPINSGASVNKGDPEWLTTLPTTLTNIQSLCLALCLEH